MFRNDFIGPGGNLQPFDFGIIHIQLDVTLDLLESSGKLYKKCNMFSSHKPVYASSYR
jgi:hypothetical protein